MGSKYGFTPPMEDPGEAERKRNIQAARAKMQPRISAITDIIVDYAKTLGLSVPNGSWRADVVYLWRLFRNATSISIDVELSDYAGQYGIQVVLRNSYRSKLYETTDIPYEAGKLAEMFQVGELAETLYKHTKIKTEASIEIALGRRYRPDGFGINMYHETVPVAAFGFHE